MPPPARVAVIDDDADFRALLREVLAASARFHLVAAWPSVAAARRELALCRPDVLVLDVDLPHIPGHTALPQLRSLHPAMQVIMITAHHDEEFVFTSFANGAVGYLTKPLSGKRILAALDEVLDGGVPLSPRVARQVIDFLASGRVSPPPPLPAANPLSRLSERDLALLSLVAAGAKDKEIAARLGLSHASVRKRLHAIYAKLGVRSRTEAALRLREGGA